MLRIRESSGLAVDGGLFPAGMILPPTTVALKNWLFPASGVLFLLPFRALEGDRILPSAGALRFRALDM